MRILGFIESSLIDWDGKIVSVIFLGGCNFKCPFCQNHPVAKDSKQLKEIDWLTVEKKLKEKSDWLDGVVVTGGEPCIHPEIFGLCRRIKDLGFNVKIDTNGYYPYILMKLTENNLVDYVAMDIKTFLDQHYEKACGRNLELGLIERTIQLLLTEKVDYEFRTTLVPKIVGEPEIKQIVDLIAGARLYALQQYVPENARTAFYRKQKPISKKEAEKLVLLAKARVKKVRLRGKFS
ncbi:MAG: anaerobic ribonucleoside-triphosphate reductase activating protein [candidate division WOR-3 bacterium]|nr:anaerobic ribonucleoside-triphosphate reductase activating protein [candidate division WOR-3 bacterium]